MPSTNKLSNYRTTWEHEGNRGSVTYVHTRIVAWEGDIVTLNSGGWQTVTTKRKMCQAANQFALRFCVFQRKGEWFVMVRPAGHTWGDDGVTLPFKDGMKFNMWTGELVA